jgi:hypothetical protein
MQLLIHNLASTYPIHDQGSQDYLRQTIIHTEIILYENQIEAAAKSTLLAHTGHVRYAYGTCPVYAAQQP